MTITDIINTKVRPQKTLKETRIKLCNTLVLPALKYGSKNWTIKARHARRITAAEVKYMRKRAGYTWTDYKTSTEIAKELNITAVLCRMQEHRRNRLQPTNRTPRNRLPRTLQKLQTYTQKKSGETIKETSRRVRPEQGNKWSSPMLDDDSGNDGDDDSGNDGDDDSGNDGDDDSGNDGDEDK